MRLQKMCISPNRTTHPGDSFFARFSMIPDFIGDKEIWNAVKNN